VPETDPAPALLGELSPLTAMGVALPPPSLLAQSVAPAPAAAVPNAPPGAAGLPLAEVEAAGEDARAGGEPSGSPEAELSQEEQSQVEQLETRDREVRQHEQAHLAAAGGYARGGASYEYETGPDGKRYAVGGEVSIDTSKVSGDPEATIRKAQIVYRAALAPAEPSSQDRSIASQAKRMEMAARQDLTKVQIEEGAGSTQEADASGQDRRDEATGQDLVATELPGSAASPATDGGDVGFLLDLLG
jgi:hypothetical protein